MMIGVQPAQVRRGRGRADKGVRYAQWDYAVYVIDDVNDIFRAAAAKLGNDGWELVSSFPALWQEEASTRRFPEAPRR